LQNEKSFEYIAVLQIRGQRFKNVLNNIFMYSDLKQVISKQVILIFLQRYYPIQKKLQFTSAIAFNCDFKLLPKILDIFLVKIT
jgi:hypothetical protein